MPGEGSKVLGCATLRRPGPFGPSAAPGNPPREGCSIPTCPPLRRPQRRDAPCTPSRRHPKRSPRPCGPPCPSVLFFHILGTRCLFRLSVLASTAILIERTTPSPYSCHYSYSEPIPVATAVHAPAPIWLACRRLLPRFLAMRPHIHVQEELCNTYFIGSEYY